MKQFKLLALVVGLSAIFTACDSENKGNSIERTFTGCFLRNTDGSEASAFINTDAQVRLFFDFDNDAADITITNFQASATSAKGSLLITDLPWSISSTGDLEINQPAPASTEMVTNLKVNFLDRAMSVDGRWLSAPILTMSFTFDNRYNVVLYQDQYIYVDNGTVVTTLADNSTYKPTKGTLYSVTLNPQAMTATLFIDNAKFDEKMPGVSMTFKDMPMQFVTGGYKIETSSLIPESDGTPYERYKITDLLCNAYLNSGATLGFTCADTWRVNNSLTYFNTTTTDTDK